MIEEFFSNFSSFQTSGSTAFKPGLDRMHFMDQMAGHPHRKYKTIHIAGTNGKGSVSSMLASSLAAKGFKVGLYTSPHILDLRERMRIVDNSGYRIISEEACESLILRWGESLKNLSCSFFEVTTFLAFCWFEEENVDYAVIEAGLGGRLDSTNIIEPVLSVITNIGYDHCDILGESLPEIAYEKAGIIKPCVPVVVGESGTETDSVFERKVLYTNLSEPKFMGDRQRIMSLLHFADKLSPAGSENTQTLLSEMDLSGIYQKANLRTVLCALEQLGITPDHDALVHTAARTGFRGRWERLSVNPELICDIGHNAHGLKYNFEQLKSMSEAGRKLILVYGSVADKDVDAVLKLIPKAEHIFFTNAAGTRALPAGELSQRYQKLCENGQAQQSPFTVSEDVQSALKAALSMAGSNGYGDKNLIYVGGSTYVVAEAVSVFKN